MPGFGSGPFGSGGFGKWPWAEYMFVELVPDIYKNQDAEIGFPFFNFLSSVAPLFQYIHDKVVDLDQLRDPLTCQSKFTFSRQVVVLKVDDLKDGTSRVFLSQGANGDAFDKLRPGMTIQDSSGVEFSIVEINSGSLASEFNNPPIDPFTDTETGKHVIVENISLANLEQIPLVSGYLITNENPTPTPLDNGTNVGPYVFTVALPPLAGNLVTVTWTESAVLNTGYFDNTGAFSGQLRPGSAISFTTGQITIVPVNGVAVDSNSIRVTYTTQCIYRENPTLTPSDNGTNVGPYVFTVAFPPLAAHQVILEWTESSVSKVGYFSSVGTPSGALTGGSSINFTTGTITAVNTGGAAIDSDSMRVTYLSEIVLAPSDAVINGQNLLALLGGDYAATPDAVMPEPLQRAFVYHAYQLWNIKGTDLGYEILGKFFGFSVKPKRLYKIVPGFSASVGISNTYIFAGKTFSSENPGTGVDNYIAPLETGSFLGPFTIQIDNAPIYEQNNIILTWTEGGIAKTAYLDPSNVISGTDSANISSWTATRVDGNMVVTFASSHAPDADSVRVTYTQGQWYTDIDPDTVYMDDVVLDVIPLDSYCFDDDDLYPSSPHYPNVSQTVDITSVSVVAIEGSKTRYKVVADTSVYLTMHLSFGTEAKVTDFASNKFVVETFERISNTSYSFEVVDSTAPVVGKAAVVWQVVKNLASLVTDDPDTTPGSTISPDENGVATGPFSIQLANFPVWNSAAFNTDITVNWSVSSVAKTAILTGDGTPTVSGANAADVSSVTVSRSAGTVTITFVSAPDTDSIRIKYPPVSDFEIIGIGTDMSVLGLEFVRYNGIRYKLTKTFNDQIVIGNVGNWKLIDSDGHQAWIENIRLISSSPYIYEMEFISDQPLSAGPANMFYECQVITSCSYCAAAAVRMTIEAAEILDYPEIDVSAASDRLILALRQMLPMHVRIADFELV